ncbi:CDP-glycerol glycerophosphotransferase family protein [Microbulbifer sp. JMSA008]|uniref:CDP-glycerol glycerophosphotransferase family protein n=1 Tax=Microbulbifer sp. JMSA008 TaxID=3243373 RepID=UPI004039D1BA
MRAFKDSKLRVWVRRKVTLKSWLLKVVGRIARTDEVVFIDVPGLNDLYKSFYPVFKSKYFLYNRKLNFREEFRIARAKVIVSSCGAVKREVNWGGRRIELWHASGAIKKIRNYSYAKIREDYLVAAPSQYLCQLYSSSFGAVADNVLAIGHPKTDKYYLSSVVEQRSGFIFKKYPQLRDKKLYLFAPTFRKSLNGIAYYSTSIDFHQLADRLKSNEVVIVKLHPLVLKSMGQHNIPEVNNKIVHLPEEHIDDLLMVANVIVSDYSSIIFDSVLLKKPIVSLAEDIDDYQMSSGLALDYRVEIPFTILEKASDEFLIQCLRAAKVNERRYEDFSLKYLDACDGKSVKRVLKCVSQLLGKDVMLSKSVKC